MTENDAKPTENNSSCKDKMWNTFANYSEESSIHSMSYIGKRHIHWIERIFWILAFLFSFSCCFYLVYATYLKWNNEPMLVTFNEKATPTWQIPFPAITICPESKTNVDKFNLTQIRQLITANKPLRDHQLAAFAALNGICDIKIPKGFSSKTNYVDALRRVTNNFAAYSNYTLAHSTQKRFDYDFLETITDEGVCRSFNMLNGKDLYKNTMDRRLRMPLNESRSSWTAYGYRKDDEIFTHPYRILGSGIKAGISILLLMRKKDIDYTCKSTGSGFRLTLHTPDTMPQPSSHFYRIPFDVETLISVKPRVMSTSENLRHYKPVKRQCFFPGEKRLRFFKAYTQENCKLECFTEYVLNKCGCVKFSMPHSEDTKICKDYGCIESAHIKWTLSELGKEVAEQSGKNVSDSADEIKGMLDYLEGENVTNIEDLYTDEIVNETTKAKDTFASTIYDYDNDEYSFPISDDENGFKSCKCLPSCSSIYYDAEISQTSLNLIKHYQANKVYEKQDEQFVYAYVTIYFKEDHFIESKRSELYGWLNFLSSCGGFLGLLMGGSLLSLVEIFYHLTLKKIFKSRHEPSEK